MHCYVYKGAFKPDHYLYLQEEISGAEASLPEALLAMLGELSLVVEFDLQADRELPQADAAQVLADIKAQGFYLQMPKKDMRAEEDQLFS